MSTPKPDSRRYGVDHAAVAPSESLSRLGWQLGIAPTLGRRRVAAFFDTLDQPLDAETAWRMIAEQAPIDRSTVYRAIRMFADAGLLVEVTGSGKSGFQKRSDGVEITLYDVETGQVRAVAGGEVLRPIEQFLARHRLALAGDLEFRVRGLPLADSRDP